MCLTSGRRLVLRREDHEAEALVVFALQRDVEALGPRRLRGLDGVGKLAAGRLGRAVDQGGRHLLGLLAAVVLLAVV